MPPKEKARQQLLLEGKDDQYAIINLMKQHGIDWDDRQRPLPYVKDCSGKNNLLENELPLLLQNRSAYSVIGIVLDADESCENCWESLRSIFAKHRIETPPQIDSQAFVGESDTGLRMGVWLMPDNCEVGKLEDFLALLVPQNDSCWEYCESVLDEAKNRAAPFADKDRSKAKIHTWLAWQEKPGQPFGQAITARCLNSHHEIAVAFANWFSKLYKISISTP